LCRFVCATTFCRPDSRSVGALRFPFRFRLAQQEFLFVGFCQRAAANAAGLERLRIEDRTNYSLRSPASVAECVADAREVLGNARRLHRRAK